MVRVGGLKYMCDPTEAVGTRITNLTSERQSRSMPERSTRLPAGHRVPRVRRANRSGTWSDKHLRAQKVVRSVQSNSPTLVGVATNPGYAAEEAVTRPAAAPAPANQVPTKAPAPTRRWYRRKAERKAVGSASPNTRRSVFEESSALGAEHLLRRGCFFLVILVVDVDVPDLLLCRASPTRSPARPGERSASSDPDCCSGACRCAPPETDYRSHR